MWHIIFIQKEESDEEDLADTTVEDDTTYLSKYTVTLPPEPLGRCSKPLQVVGYITYIGTYEGA